MHIQSKNKFTPVLALLVTLQALLPAMAVANSPISQNQNTSAQTPAKPNTAQMQPKLVSVNEPSLDTVANSQQLSAHIISNYTGRKYRLGPNDVLTVNVYDSPEFSQEDLLVQPDGNITVAPFGSVNVAGMTIDEFQKDMTDRLKMYLNKPMVTIKLVHTKPFQVYVSGAVLRPGPYELLTDITRNQMVQNTAPGLVLERKLPLLSNVLIASGGLRYDADLEHVKIHNKFDGSSFEVNLLDLVQNGNSDQDMFLIAGDTVEVPKLATPYAVDDTKYQVMLGSSIFQKEIPVKIYGYVNRPGLVMLDGAQTANLNSAIGQAGGYLSTEASYAPNKVYVSRVDGNGRMTTTTIDPRHSDMAMRPNDIVYVPNKITPRVGKAFDYLTRIIVPAGAIATGMNSWALLFDPNRFQVNVNSRQ